MTGEGRATFAGAEVETFGVEVLGVLQGAMPDRSIILARLSGGPLAHTGVMQGMSGSPVYLDGRLAGAVAYAFPYAKDPICGITPFEEMVRFTEPPATARGGGTGAAGAARRGAPQLKFSPEGRPFIDPPPPAPSAAGGSGQLRPILTPVTATGLPTAAVAALGPLFHQLGMALAPTGFTARTAVSGSPPQTPPALLPGSPVGATLIGGDLVFMASGTVTHVDESTGEVYAFGHPFTGLGSLSIPMQEARVETPVASLMNSFLLASAGAPIGVWQQDRVSGIRGRLGVRARTIPMQIEVRGSRGAHRSYALELVDHDLFTPAMAFSGLLSILSQEERPASPLTVRLEAQIDLAGGRSLPVEDVFASGAAGVVAPAAALVAAPVALLLGNPVERVPVRSIAVNIEATEEARAATLTRAWLRSSRVRPGEPAILRVAVRDFRGAERVRELEIPIPASAAGSRLQLTVADALTTTFQDRSLGVGGIPTHIGQVFRAIARHRRQSRLVVQLRGGAREAGVVGGEFLPSLPPSVRSVLNRDPSRGPGPVAGRSVVWEGHLDFDATVTGARVLTLEVETW